MLFIENDKYRQKFQLDRLDESLTSSIQFRRRYRKRTYLDAGLLQSLSKVLCIFSIPVMSDHCRFDCSLPVLLNKLQSLFINPNQIKIL